MNFIRLPQLGLGFALALVLAGPAAALEPQIVNAASFMDRYAHGDQAGPDPFIVKAQVLLGRRSISPGVIDGVDGENFRKAIAQFRRQEGLQDGQEIDELAWLALKGDETTDIVADYRLTDGDTSYDFAAAIPRDYARQARMKRLSYTSPQEMLGERFHMSEALLAALNPSSRYSATGEIVSVVSVPRLLAPGTAERVAAIKSTGMVVVYGPGDTVLASYPATIGSEDTPSPSGEHTIERIARNPEYSYNPDKNFQQGKNTKKLTLPPGPNGPVGSVWIALSKPTYGIHGTPEPSQVSKTNSHGCIRLTNWDASELADLVKPGIAVRFVE